MLLYNYRTIETAQFNTQIVAKHDPVHTWAKLWETNLKVAMHEIQLLMKYMQINIESSNLQQRPECVLLCSSVLSTLHFSYSWYPCQQLRFSCGFSCLTGVEVVVGLNPTKYR